jgi:riboflavin kinase/FMN adenylyltransferase
MTATVATVGTFDGIHRGHQAVLADVVRRARSRGLVSLLVTFDPHPLEVLQPERAPVPITTLEERFELIAETGIDTTVVVAFTRVFAAVESEDFVSRVLVGTLKAQDVVVGFNHRFGRGARGDALLLERLGGELGFRAHVVAPMTVDGVPVSSSEIRSALGRGDLPKAEQLLGRPYSIQGEVVRGAGRGRTLGFPTANVRTARPLLLPPGVYACQVDVGGQDYQAVINVGVRPTFGETELAVEAHLLDFSGNIYGRRIRLTFLRRLREERKFPSVEALRNQIALDVLATRRGS